VAKLSKYRKEIEGINAPSRQAFPGTNARRAALYKSGAPLSCKWGFDSCQWQHHREQNNSNCRECHSHFPYRACFSADRGRARSVRTYRTGIAFRPVLPGVRGNAMNVMSSVDANRLVVTETGDELWYKDAIIYQLHVKAFADSNNDGIGDFAGLTEKLGYLQDLGVTTLWLLPFYPPPGRDAGND